LHLQKNKHIYAANRGMESRLCNIEEKNLTNLHWQGLQARERGVIEKSFHAINR
jgi:hypothetical protein